MFAKNNFFLHFFLELSGKVCRICLSMFSLPRALLSFFHAFPFDIGVWFAPTGLWSTVQLRRITAVCPNMNLTDQVCVCV